jgi:enoyl-CoA hydratase/carnithine racemase
MASEPQFTAIEYSFDETTGVGRITLNRPDALNALSGTLRREFVEAFDALRQRDAAVDGVAVRAVVVSGAGDAFSVGADVDEFVEGTDVLRPGMVYDAASRFPAPVIASIDGYCLGGGLVLALDCDVRFASERSEFGLPEVDLGISVSGEGLAALCDLVGPERAKRLAATGERVDATRAEQLGIIGETHPANDLSAAVDAFVETIAAKPPLAVRETFDIVDAYGRGAGKHYERRADDRLRRSRDYAEAIAAFREDRDPEFEGR